MTDAHAIYTASVIPCDEDLLEPLGRVVWAAIRLQHTVRDLIGAIEGELSGRPFEPTLGGAISNLRKLASSLEPVDRQRIEDWCNGDGASAKNARDSVLHAVAFTAPEGRQAIMRHGRHGSGRFTADEINMIAGTLELAAGKLHGASNGVKRPWN